MCLRCLRLASSSSPCISVFALHIHICLALRLASLSSHFIVVFALHLILLGVSFLRLRLAASYCFIVSRIHSLFVMRLRLASLRLKHAPWSGFGADFVCACSARNTRRQSRRRNRSKTRSMESRLDLIPYTFTHAFAFSFTERRRTKNMDIEQHGLLLIAVAHTFMQLITHNMRINHRSRSLVGHTLMALVQLVAH